MSATKPSLNLEPWNEFLSQERSGDFKYNLLLQRFRSFYNEVKEYQALHTNCSPGSGLARSADLATISTANTTDSSQPLTKATNTTNSDNKQHSLEQLLLQQQQASATAIQSPSIAARSLAFVDKARVGPMSAATTANNKQNAKPALQHQHSMPGDSRHPLESRFHDANHSKAQQNTEQPAPQLTNHIYQHQQQKQLRMQQQQQQHRGSGPQNHHNSSHNLTTIINDLGKAAAHPNSTKTKPPSDAGRPEVRERLQNAPDRSSAAARLLVSKSSERLDSINNNNHQYLGANRQHRTLNSHNVGSLGEQAAGEQLNADNIYDAVSPEDLQLDESTPDSSMQDLNPVYKSSSGAARPALERQLRARHNCDPTEQQQQQQQHQQQQSRINYSNSSRHNMKWPSLDYDTTKTNSQDVLTPTNQPLDNSGSSSSTLAIPAELRLAARSRTSSPIYANYVNMFSALKSEELELEDDQANNADCSMSSCTSDTGSEEGRPARQRNKRPTRALSRDALADEATDNLAALNLAQSLTRSRDNNLNSSASMTPASSGDLLDEHTRTHFSMLRGSKFSSFISSDSHDNGSTSCLNNEHSSININQSSDEQSFSHQTSGTSFDSRVEYSRYGPSSANSAPNNNNNNNTNNKQARQAAADEAARRASDQMSHSLADANNTMRSFLSNLNLSQSDDTFDDKTQRRIVKESFAVELCGRRKLRHLFLFNDVIVCAKYQASAKQKFTFDVKWHLNLKGISILDPNNTSNHHHTKTDDEAIENQILAIRTSLMLLRAQMQHAKRTKRELTSKAVKKLKKKKTELEAELVLLLPHLPLIIQHSNGKKYTFFLSSNFDRNQWIESIKILQSQLAASLANSSLTSRSTPIPSPSSNELQAWIETCRKNLNPTLGTFLLRPDCDDDLLYGDLYLNLSRLNGITNPGYYYFCFEVDSYGHFTQRASSNVLHIGSAGQDLNEEYVFPLDGAHSIRILLYEDQGSNIKPLVVEKAQIELSRAWTSDRVVDKTIIFSSQCSLQTRLTYSSSELLSTRVPHAKLCPTFGVDITQVCKKEKTKVPLLIQLCVGEVERRGMREVGIYRMSGTSTDIQKLKKTFETNPYVAELLLRDIDINSVTGFLKTYLREIPEGLFMNKMYLKFVSAFNIPQSETYERTKRMLDLFHSLPKTNQETITYLVDHLVRLNKHESHNKMSLTNLATVLGPNILRPPSDSHESTNGSDPFTTVVINSMSQAGILYFFLERKFSKMPLTELDPSETLAAAVRSGVSQLSSPTAHCSAK